MKTISNYVNKIINIFTTIIIILLLISVIASFQTTFFGKKYNSFFGYALFEIKTASMAGEMEIGDWIIVEITDDVNLNDIVTFEQDGAFITHRIIEQYKDTYVTKGYSNNSKDTPIKKEQIVGKMVKVMPKFGIIKKTFFNTKVLIVLIITILVGSSLIDKNNKKTNKKTNIKKEKNINKKPKEQDVLINIEQNNIDLNEETIDIIEKTIEKQQSNIKEDELSNTMVLSKIVVEMNSKTLAAISKKFEDTKAIDIVENNEQVQKEKEPKIILVTYFYLSLAFIF